MCGAISQGWTRPLVPRAAVLRDSPPAVGALDETPGRYWREVSIVPYSAGNIATDKLIVGAPSALAHVPTFGALVDNFIRNIGAGASQNGEHANCRMVIEHENVVLSALRYLGTPVALPISEDAKELTGRHVVMLSIDPHPDKLLKVHRARRFGVLGPSQPAATAATFSHIER